jgi:flap endonuclease-1|tara:strand:- start:1129 stop:2133 length:1005 start_codon:yes stop_codon:yes gene_type:complete
MGCNLRDLAPSQPIDFSELKGEKVAIDVFLNAYQFITSLTGQDGKPLSYNGKPVAHLMGFLDRATIMIEEGIDPVFIFDGKPHEMKMETLGVRKERKISAVAKWEAAIDSGDMTAAKKLGPQTAEYTRDMVAETKELFDCLGVSWIEAPMEAEGAAAVRCRNKEVFAVASQDWDTLLYGAPVMIRNLTSHGTRKFGRVLQAEKIVLKDMLEMHQITYEQLVDLGIMIGTDFHEGIKGIGPKTGLKLIKAHGTMEEISIVKEFELPENLEEIRQIFRNHPVHPTPLPNSSKSIEENLSAFAKSRGFSEKRINRAITRLANSNRLKSDSQPTLFDF